MKLNPEFIIQQVGDSVVLVPVGEAAGKFHGIVQMNKTAAFIASCMQEETTEEKIIAAMGEKYEGTGGEFAESVRNTLEKLRERGALEE
jgi:hypothetical protein